MFTALASFQILQQQLDSRLESAIERPAFRSRPGSTGTNTGTDEQTSPGDPGGSGLIRVDATLGQDAAGNLVVTLYRDPTRPDSISRATVVQLLAAVANRVNAAPFTVRVNGGGLYRVQVRTDAATP